MRPTRLLAVCFSLEIGGGYEARRFGKRGMGRDMGAVFSRLAFFPTRPYLPSPSSLQGQRHLRSR